MRKVDTDQELDGCGGLSKESAALALTHLVEKVFSATLIAPALSQIGLTLGDQVKFFRIRNLVRLNEHLEEVLKERNLNSTDLKRVSLSVGFPLLEKASYQDDDMLQKNWANLIASAMEKKDRGEDGFSLDITYVEILHQFSRLDCEVLEYIAENGVSGRGKEGEGLILSPLDPVEVRNQFPRRPAHIAIEKLVNLGCAYRVLRTPLSSQEGDGYGALSQDLVVTLTGLNLYVSASGKNPKWNKVYRVAEELRRD